eukprot:TRINITY_DN3073_c0_g7_i1.p1 TRINITY_DN3073_c0_g7~~TRINITY_DN3073_c0_g7_i1.p1  ORF type:complete len:232 (+),score=72.80 TRINITY_DN3073_c0_g7_i1:55-750(+)
MAAAAAPQVLRELNNNWLECMDEQGVYYFNQATQQSSDYMPADAQDAQAQYAQPLGQGAAGFQQVQPIQPVQYAQPAQQAVQSAQPARKKMIIGSWWVMEDAQGVFFLNSETQQELNEVPPELANIYPSVAHLNSHVVQPSGVPLQAAPQVQHSQMYVQAHHGQVAAPAVIQHQPMQMAPAGIYHQQQQQQQYTQSFMPPQQYTHGFVPQQLQQQQMPVQMMYQHGHQVRQ